jgi:hypothetical protein
MLVLKQQLKEARIPQAVVARAVAVSEATLAQIVNHNEWPRTSPKRCASVWRPGWKVRGLIQRRVLMLHRALSRPVQRVLPIKPTSVRKRTCYSKAGVISSNQKSVWPFP